MTTDNKTAKTEVKKGLLFNKKDDSQSAYGLTVQTICQNPTIDKTELYKVLEANNINLIASKSAIQTGISQTVKIIRMLNDNGFIKGL